MTAPTAALKLARDALADLICACKQAKVDLTAGIRDGDPVHPVSAALTWPLATAINALAAIDALPASVPAWPCHCDDRGIGQPGVTCGDCPKDYGHTVTQASAPGGEPHPLTLLQAGLNNAELLAQWRKKLPGVEPTDRELSAFAVGTEVGWQRATAQAAPAPAPTEHEREMAASLLKAMARNYAAGHAWDHLDGKACTNAARLLRTQAPAVPVVQALTDAEIDALRGLDTAQRVRFYEHDFYVLSNFSAFRVTFEGQTFDTSEAAYHYQRFTDAEDRRAIQYAYSAHEAFRYAQDNKTHQRDDWDAVKVETMRRILRAKADQHEYVRRKLLETGDRELVEDSWRDDFWGWGPNRDGRNMLGRLWMEIRAELASAGDAAQGAQP